MALISFQFQLFQWLASGSFVCGPIIVNEKPTCFSVYFLGSGAIHIVNTLDRHIPYLGFGAQTVNTGNIYVNEIRICMLLLSVAVDGALFTNTE